MTLRAHSWCKCDRGTDGIFFACSSCMCERMGRDCRFILGNGFAVIVSSCGAEVSKTPSTKSLKRSSLVFVGAQVGWKSAIQNATGYDYEFPRFCYEKFDKPIWHDAREANCYR